jgi:UDP-N-acetyl-D-mannosaminuronate dehydrogenase
MSAQQPQILAIIGQGYVGLPLAMAAVDAGWTVIGVDNFEAKVAQINSGSSPVEDISDSQLKAALSKGVYILKLSNSDYESAVFKKIIIQ